MIAVKRLLLSRTGRQKLKLIRQHGPLIRLLTGAILLLLLTLLSCSRQKEQPADTVIARIGEIEITQREFLERAEYTIRPSYAKLNSYIDSKIILNSLIAENLLAMDAGDSTELARNEMFQLFLQGQKEQAMRQMFFRNHFYDPIDLPNKEVQKVYSLAGRTYDIHYISTRDEELNQRLEKELQANASFIDVVRKYSGLDTLPTRQVAFDLSEIDQVRQALFERDVQKGEIIGPLQIENEWLWLHVDGWRERIALNTQDVQNRARDVQQHLTFKYATVKYEQYVHRLMSGKRVEFNRETFVQLVNTLGMLYFPDTRQSETQVKQMVWNKQSSDDIPIDTLSTKLDRLKEKPLLTIAGQTWQVKDLNRELLLHPLQFRKKRLHRGEFAEQLKLALVDIIKDKYITQKAYDEGYAADPYVLSRERMWRTAFLAGEIRNNQLASLGLLDRFEQDYLSIIETHLNPRIEKLQRKYAPQIEINTDLLVKTDITRIDMFAVYQDQPYPIVVPPFPLLTTDSQLDYGRKLEIIK